MPTIRLSVLLALALPLAVGCAGTGRPSTAAAPQAAPAEASGLPSFEPRLLADGRVWVAAQPNADDLRGLGTRGVQTVINLRTPAEMGGLGFDEPALLAAQGIEYRTLPVDGGGGFSPAVLDAFAAAMADPSRKVLLHCASGQRAGLLYAAWLVREQGLSPQDAMQRVAPLGLWPLPMERLLDRELVLDFAPAREG